MLTTGFRTYLFRVVLANVFLGLDLGFTARSRYHLLHNGYCGAVSSTYFTAVVDG